MSAWPMEQTAQGIHSPLSRNNAKLSDTTAHKALGIDRAGAYKAAVERQLPHADIVFYKFHIVANYNEVMDRVRRRSLT